ncbi:MAG: bacteriocin [Dysgonamonadaceae bacterium]|jgi:bacteriocin-like protein|nr:bacteriocin [Dysgonamonadaceae bacterium]
MGNKLAVYCNSYYDLLNFNYFCLMKKVNLKGVSETLSEKELKNVMGGNSTTAGPMDPIGSGGDLLIVTEIRDFDMVDSPLKVAGNPCIFKWTDKSGKEHTATGILKVSPLDGRTYCSDLR